MEIFIASDHAGFELKKKVVEVLKSNNINTFDLGPQNEDSVDYPDYAFLVCDKVIQTPTSYGILICGSGQGMAIAANKFTAIRAALCWSTEVTKLSRKHNNANVLCLGSRVVTEELNLEILNTFLNTDFEGGRHQRRVDKISKLPLK